MNDAIDRLRQKAKNRPSVAARDYSLTQSNERFSDGKQSSNKSLAAAKAAKTTPSEPEVVRRTIRLTEDLDEKIDLLCRKHKITRETFLEAAYLVTQDNEEILSDIVAVAKERYSVRKKVGLKRKTKTMQEKFG